MYLRVEVEIEDPAAVTEAAMAELRAADIDWPREEDDVESAAAELRGDLLNSLAGLADPDALFAAVPGVAVSGARVWAEAGPPDPRFEPGFSPPAPDLPTRDQNPPGPPTRNDGRPGPRAPR